jgi:long-chain acyl-CoA synthetase
VCIYYADSFLSVSQDLLEVRPQILLAVPRIFEKVYAKVRDTAVAGGFFKRAVLGWTLQVGHFVAKYRFRLQLPPWWVRLPAFVANLLVYRKVRARTGGRIRLAISGGAPLNRKVNEFFWAMGVSIFEGYGLTETSPIVAVTRPGHVRPGYVGQPLWETWEGKPYVKLAEDGEILVRGPNVMQGYWKNEQATREAFDAEGYFHTGDIGLLDRAGRLKITDRKKEILVTSGGKNVAPQPIENMLRADKYIEQAVLIGDHRNFISAILVPHFPTLRHWAQHKHLPFESDAELAGLPEVKAKLMRQVEHVNVKLSKYERVRRIIILDQEMTAENGLLTPSLKVKRRAVAGAFKERIDVVYGSNTVEIR